jgi:hypothetical protein
VGRLRSGKRQGCGTHPIRRSKDGGGLKAAQGQELQPHRRALPLLRHRGVTEDLHVQDAEQEGDQELVDFFGGILENNLEAAQQAKEMLVARLQNEQE